MKNSFTTPLLQNLLQIGAEKDAKKRKKTKDNTALNRRIIYK